MLDIRTLRSITLVLGSKTLLCLLDFGTRDPRLQTYRSKPSILHMIPRDEVSIPSQYIVTRDLQALLRRGLFARVQRTPIEGTSGSI